MATAEQAAVVRPFTLNYNETVYGAVVQAGNGNSVCPGVTAPTDPFGEPKATCATAQARTYTASAGINDSYYMQWADVDASAATYNSSTASVTIPAGASIQFARLSWSGDTGTIRLADGTISALPGCNTRQFLAGAGTSVLPSGTPESTSIRLTVGTGSAVAVAPQVISRDALANVPASQPQFYAAHATVTAQLAAITTGSAQTITVGNVWTPQGFGCYAGWSLVVVYRYDAPRAEAPFAREIFIYDGHVRQSSVDPSTTVAVIGFRAGGSGVRVGLTAYEGDFNTSGDAFSINGTAVAEPLHGSTTTNFFVSDAQADQNPATLNNMSVDSKELATSLIPTGATSANLTFSTSGDTYLAQNAVVSVPVPSLNVTMTLQTAGPILAGQQVSYEISVISPGGTNTTTTIVDSNADDCDRDLGTVLADVPVTYTCVGVADSSNFTATATATASDPFGDPLSDSASVDVTVSRLPQTISFTSTAPTDAVVGGSTYTVTATATSGLTVALTIDASSASVCTLAGGVVSFIGAGSCVINADQAGDPGHDPAPRVQQTFTVGRGAQTISFGTLPNKLLTDGPFTVSATGGASGNPVTFSTSTPACSVTGTTVTLVAAGTCTIQADQAGNANYDAAPPVPQTFTISRATQTISFTSTAPTTAAVGGAAYTVTATASSELPVVLAIDASSSTVCALSGATVSFIGVGTCVINADQAGNASYEPAPQAQQAFAVGQGTQTIDFAPLTGKLMTDAPFEVSATGGASGNPVTFSTTSLTCTVSGTTVTVVAVGTCEIQADQAGNANYAAAPPVTQSFTISRATQTISFTSTAPTAAVVNGETYIVSAISTSGLTVALSIDATSDAVCTITDDTVSFIGVGDCVINADQAGDANHEAATQVQQTFTVGRGAQTISFATLDDKLMTDAPFDVSATGGASGNAVAFSTTSPACTVNGTTVTLVAAGTCTIQADQAGNAHYNDAAPVTQSFTISRASQTITFPAIPNFSWNGGSAALAASASSNLDVVYTVLSGPCSVTGATLTATAAGTCSVAADQAGDDRYAAATREIAMATVANTNQTIAFAPIESFSWRDGSATLAATATSGLAVVYSVLSGPCSIAGVTLTATAAGACSVAADQPGNANYAAADQVIHTVAVAKATQTIAFEALADRLAIDPAFTVGATSDSANPITFSTTSTACSVTGTTVTLVAAGACAIRADQAEDDNYLAATPVVQMFTVSRATQATTFPALQAFSWKGGSAALSATASSELLVAYSVRSGPCSIVDNTVTATTAGTCVVAANQAGDGRYLAAPTITATVIVNKADQTIEAPSFEGELSLRNPVTLNAIATSGLPISYRVEGPCRIAGSTLIATGSGTCVVTANQAGNASYNAAPEVSASVTAVAGTTGGGGSSGGGGGGGCSTTGDGASSSLAILIVVLAVFLRRRARWLLAATLAMIACGDNNHPGTRLPELESSVLTLTLLEGSAITIDPAAIDPQGKPLSYETSLPAHGAVSGTGPMFSYQAVAAYNGTDSFTITVSNDIGSATVTVNLTITPVNDPPIADDQELTIDEDDPVAIVLVAIDPEGATLTYGINAQPAHGVLTGTPPNVTYTPNLGYTGSDQLTFEASDGGLLSNVATVTIMVDPSS